MEKDTYEKYLVGKKLGETDEFRLYECKLPDGKVAIFKIAVEVESNGILDRESDILRTMRDAALLYEAEYVKVSGKPDATLGYQIMFPNLIDSFVLPEQGDRRVSILSFTNVGDDLGRMVPIGHITERDRVRIDPKTSAWVLGKLLKLLVFTHNQGIINGRLTGDNVLIEPDQHYVSVFDWSCATRSPFGGILRGGDAGEEISQVTSLVIEAMGGDPDTGELLPDSQLTDKSYQNFLIKLLTGYGGDAVSAHADFYETVRSLWSRGFWPFTTYKL